MYDLLPETQGHDLRSWELPQLRACGVTIVGFRGRGVAAGPNLDSQAEVLAGYLRAKHVDLPANRAIQACNVCRLTPTFAATSVTDKPPSSTA